MKRRLLPLLLSLSLLCSLLPAALAGEESSPSVTALCAAEPGESVYLDVEEFRTLCRQATGHELETVAFSSLPASVGALTFEGKQMPSDTAYYSNDYPQISEVCFTPYSSRSRNFTGQAQLSFTMTSRREETVSGVLVLYVPEEPDPVDEDPTFGEDFSSDDTAFDKTFAVNGGQPVSLDDYLPFKLWRKVSSKPSEGPWAMWGSGFYVECEVTSGAFTRLPSSAQGSLWLNYGTPKARKVLPGEVLLRAASPSFYDATFVPATREAAEICLDFTVSCEGATDIPGRLTLNLKDPKGTDSADQSSSRPSPKPVTVQPSPATVSTNTAQVGLATALYQACASREEGSLKTVAFDTLPPTGTGTILSGDVPVTAGEAYPYNTLSFLPGDRFQNNITLRYVGADSKDKSFSGTLTLALDYPPEGRFRDLTGWEWASYAVKFLDTQKAVPYSKSNPSFRPGDPATRMELVCALVQVAYPDAEKVAAPDFSDLPDDADLSNAAAVAISKGLVQGDGEGHILPDAQVTRQDALVMLHRALTDLGRDLPPAGDLSSFSDAGDLAPYAQEAAAVLCANGVLRGDGSGRLNPLSPITRAEMACLLYRAFGE